MPKVTVIIPVYRVENLLSQCLDSIIAQTVKDWECLLIDDGSPDLSGKICDEYASKDSRFRVFHTANRGASAARNYGIDKARGEWIVFVDSDDIVTSTYVENLLNSAKTNDLLVMSNYIEDRSLGNDIYLSGAQISTYFINNQLFALSGPVAKLYCKDIIRRNKICFPENINMGEDAIFILKYLNEITNVAIVNKIDYIVRPTEGSLSSRYYSFESEYECYKEWKRLLVRFFSKWEGRERSTSLAWENRVEDQFRRTMLCVYRNGISRKVREQVSYLNKIDNKDLEEYRKYAKPDNWRRKLNWWLICNKWFKIYCLLGKFDFLFYNNEK